MLYIKISPAQENVGARKNAGAKLSISLDDARLK
jgi:hypothetical protein